MSSNRSRVTNTSWVSNTSGGSIRGNTVICVKYSEWWYAYAKNVDDFYPYYCPVTVTSVARWSIG